MAYGQPAPANAKRTPKGPRCEGVSFHRKSRQTLCQLRQTCGRRIAAPGFGRISLRSITGRPPPAAHPSVRLAGDADQEPPQLRSVVALGQIMTPTGIPITTRHDASLSQTSGEPARDSVPSEEHSTLAETHCPDLLTQARTSDPNDREQSVLADRAPPCSTTAPQARSQPLRSAMQLEPTDSG